LLPDSVGEKGGIYISSANRQRINLARQIIKQPKLLLCDDMTATSSLDAITVHNSMLNLCKQNNTTLVMVTHQLKYAINADIIYVLDKGKIVQKGTHHDLLKDSNNLYQKLWIQQQQYY
jgi:ATP-binding cassette subfamily B protein